MISSKRRCGVRSGFTLVELLVVIGIILVLLGILLPVANKIIAAAHKADTTAQITKLATAIQAYFTTNGSYPGPVPESSIWGYNTLGDGSSTISPSTCVSNVSNITSSQNLVLGLLGGLTNVPPNGTPVSSIPIYFDVNQIANGNGPRGLNVQTPQQLNAYVDFVKTELPQDSTGVFTSFTAPSMTPAGYVPPWKTTTTMVIPEFVDHFPNPHPIIYLRARPGAQGICDNVIASGLSGSPWYSMEMAPYWVVYDGTDGDRTPNSTLKPFPSTPNGPRVTATQTVPSPPQWSDAISFFQNQTLQDKITPRSKDSFILISAGADGIYGTPDDIIYSN